jgi:GNAT superfamily N-acetyltransferase
MVLLAFKQKQAIGFLNAIEGFSTFACQSVMNIHDVFVLQEYRGQGISKQLFQAIEDHAAANNCSKMTLEVLAGNTLAQSAYTNFGYGAPNSSTALGDTFFWEKKL